MASSELVTPRPNALVLLAVALVSMGVGAAASMLWRERREPAVPSTAREPTRGTDAPPGPSLAGANSDGGDQGPTARRIAELEAAEKRLLAEMDALRARAPQLEACFRSELAARYSSTVGERPPEEWLDAESGLLARQARLFTDASIRGMSEARRQLPVPTLAAPVVILQLRCGEGGGSPHRIDMLGKVSRYVAGRAAAEMPWPDEIDALQAPHAFALGGKIPDGRVLVVTNVKWRALSRGDSNGPGEFSITMGSETIDRRSENGSFSGTWSGRFEIHPGEESAVQVQFSNSGAVDARFEGEFEDEKK